MPIFSASSSGSAVGQFAPTVATFNEEYDEMVRECEVLIYLTPLPIAILKDLDWNSVKHWALVFKYDNRTILFELVNLTGSMVGGLIKPSWTDFQGGDKGMFSSEVSLGKIKTSPREVYLTAKNHPMNDTKYHVKNNNCQEWVMIMLDLVDLLNLKNIEEIEQVQVKNKFLEWLKAMVPVLPMKSQSCESDCQVRPNTQKLLEIVEQKGIRPLKDDGYMLSSSVGSCCSSIQMTPAWYYVVGYSILAFFGYSSLASIGISR